MEDLGTDWTPKEPKRLFKSRKDKKLFGVCGGFAKYLECDPTIIRLLTVLCGLMWGTGIVIYLACALVMPFEEDAAE